MARIDKTESAIGVVRATLAADIDLETYPLDTIAGASINASGLAVVGAAGQTGFVGIVIPNKWLSKAGSPADIFKHGDVVDIAGLAAGTHYWLDAAGKLTAVSAAGLTYAGYTVEADRLVLSGFAGTRGAL